ncbi:LysR family transcriptional regulator [Teredinibacter turnerae]|uniref:LysR family transcriptional regulator n=1 Tax=Teredinibacter turnerae TaxID=2426 RepID=UPI00036C8508|nr:LysR family transcriptional regulator [Teredinibacter turnerae]
MEMSQIKYFIAVSETLNFTRAAEQCCVSQPALTKGIKKLESIIGGELLCRTKNSVELSHLGRLLLPNFVDIYTNARRTKEEANRILEQQAEFLRIGFQHNLSFNLVCRLLDNYRHINSELDFTFLECSGPELDEKMRHHELDLIFASRIHTGNSNYVDTIHQEPFVIVFDFAHDYLKRESLFLNDLEHQRILFRDHCDSSVSLCERIQAEGLNIKATCSSCCDDWIPNYVRSEQGIALIPKSSAISYGLPYLTICDFPVQLSVYFELHHGVQTKYDRRYQDLALSFNNGSDLLSENVA